MRNLLCVVLFLLCAGPTQAQPELLLFDGKTTSGWVIEGDAEVKDGVLILGGNRKTWARMGTDFSPDFELHLEYRSENNKHIQCEVHNRRFLGQGMGSVSLEGPWKKPGEWIEAIFLGKEDAARKEWSTHSKWRVIGEPAFADQPLGGGGRGSDSVFVALEIPAGQKLYLRNVRVKTNPVASLPWLLISVAGGLVLVVIALTGWAIMKRRRAPTQGTVQAGERPA